MSDFDFMKIIELSAEIKKKHKGESGDISGTTKCPECGGELSYTIAGFNGHCHGRCGSDGCIQWME